MEVVLYPAVPIRWTARKRVIRIPRTLLKYTSMQVLQDAKSSTGDATHVGSPILRITGISILMVLQFRSLAHRAWCGFGD